MVIRNHGAIYFNRLKMKFSINIKKVYFKKSDEINSDYFSFLLTKTKEDYNVLELNSLYLSSKPSLIEKGIFIEFPKKLVEFNNEALHFEAIYRVLSMSKINLDARKFEVLYFYIFRISELNNTRKLFKVKQVQNLFSLILLEVLEHFYKKYRLDNKKCISFEFIFLVHQNFRKIRFVKEYAELLSVSVDTLEKKIRKDLGKTPILIINEIRLSEIKRLILFDRYSHKEISYMLNFDSPATYSRFVKKHTKMTPTNLKNELIKSMDKLKIIRDEK